MQKPTYTYTTEDDKLVKIVKRMDKHGVEREYKYNQTDYLKKFQDAHADELRSRIECSCGKSYAKWNASHHLKSQYHLKRV
jgi:hypothetical protein